MKIGIKELVKNSGILVISNVSLKAISFFLLPLYTEVLPPSAYGVTDTIINAATLLSAIFSLSLDWGMNTYFYEEDSDDYFKKVTSSGMLFFLLSAIACAMLIVFSNKASEMLFGVPDYRFAVTLGVLMASTKLLYFPQRVSTRMRGNLKMVGIFSAVESIATILCNILFILVLRMGYISILFSHIIGQMVSFSLYTLESRKYIALGNADVALVKKMLKYSIPITPTLIFDWINGVSDRYVIGYFFSQTEVGLYGMGTRIVSIVSLFTSSFLSAYASFAYSNAKKEKREQYAVVFDVLTMVIISMAIFVTLFAKEVISIMTSEAYHSSYIVIGVLTFAHVIHTLGLVAGYGITIQKKGVMYLMVSGGGAVGNIVLNFLLTPRFSYMGAAVATLFTEIVIFIISYVVSQRLFKCDYNIYKVILCFCLGIFFSYWGGEKNMGIKIAILVAEMIVIGVIYFNRVKWIFFMAVSKYKSR